MRAERVIAEAAVVEPVGVRASVSEESGVVGRDVRALVVWVLKVGRGRRREVKLGDGGSGVGGRL